MAEVHNEIRLIRVINNGTDGYFVNLAANFGDYGLTGLVVCHPYSLTVATQSISMSNGPRPRNDANKYARRGNTWEIARINRIYRSEFLDGSAIDIAFQNMLK
jgi:hypothetical protein